jgi:hypothetical protein
MNDRKRIWEDIAKLRKGNAHLVSIVAGVDASEPHGDTLRNMTLLKLSSSPWLASAPPHIDVPLPDASLIVSLEDLKAKLKLASDTAESFREKASLYEVR